MWKIWRGRTRRTTQSSWSLRNWPTRTQIAVMAPLENLEVKTTQVLPPECYDFPVLDHYSWSNWFNKKRSLFLWLFKLYIRRKVSKANVEYEESQDDIGAFCPNMWLLWSLSRWWGSTVVKIDVHHPWKSKIWAFSVLSFYFLLAIWCQNLEFSSFVSVFYRLVCRLCPGEGWAWQWCPSLTSLTSRVRAQPLPVWAQQQDPERVLHFLSW